MGNPDTAVVVKQMICKYIYKMYINAIKTRQGKGYFRFYKLKKTSH